MRDKILREMDKIEEVKLKIRGLHLQGEEEEEAVEVVSIGKMYEEEGAICIGYEEVTEENEEGIVQTAKCLLKIAEESVEVIKNGDKGSQMLFMPGQTTYTYYSTPFGEIEIGLHTEYIKRTEKERGFQLNMGYDMEMNQSFVSRCNVEIEVEN